MSTEEELRSSSKKDRTKLNIQTSCSCRLRNAKATEILQVVLGISTYIRGGQIEFLEGCTDSFVHGASL